ncbi:homospermidine synthase [Reticulomyxa filosa]|uniref:Homospermidine synthase n=1 Tax=Reticulomyxa filosa TaxID=46433 RepID=X6LTE2_RETFI|nr:homospermidine synthase [Reticulomyxa filosa]|eukprot:ETO05208.1 homospermidine synthase [Reticulomyxa filosa]
MEKASVNTIALYMHYNSFFEKLIIFLQFSFSLFTKTTRKKGQALHQKIRLLGPLGMAMLLGRCSAASISKKSFSHLQSFGKWWNHFEAWNSPVIKKVIPAGNITQRRQGLNTSLPKSSTKNFLNYDGKILIIGYGSIGSGTLPLILRHINIPLENITVITADDRGKEALHDAKRFGVNAYVQALTKDNYKQILSKHLKAGDFCLNLSVDVCSVDVMEFCAANKVLYLDTVIEPWKGGYTDTNKTISERSNYALREDVLALKRKCETNKWDVTQISCHGANPGMVSHFVKHSLLTIAKDTGSKNKTVPTTQEGWAKLANDLGIKCIHIAERDAQVSNIPKKRGEFVNTWSVDGFLSEGMQPAELGYGTHEKALPFDGRKHNFGNDSAIYLEQPGCVTKVRSWTPIEGSYHGYLITHNESITISDYFTHRNGNGKLLYRPTVHYSYHPCDAAISSLHELYGKNLESQSKHRLMVEEITEGIDELGVLLCGHAKNAYWFGSQLDVRHAREMAENNQATSLQVCSSTWAGMLWALYNPKRGVVECEQMDYEFIMKCIEPYISPLHGEYTTWTPVEGRGIFFPDDRDLEDPWQFKNIRVREMHLPEELKHAHKLMNNSRY